MPPAPPPPPFKHAHHDGHHHDHDDARGTQRRRPHAGVYTHGKGPVLVTAGASFTNEPQSVSRQQQKQQRRRKSECKFESTVESVLSPQHRSDCSLPSCVCPRAHTHHEQHSPQDAELPLHARRPRPRRRVRVGGAIFFLLLLTVTCGGLVSGCIGCARISGGAMATAAGSAEGTVRTTPRCKGFVRAPLQRTRHRRPQREASLNMSASVDCCSASSA